MSTYKAEWHILKIYHETNQGESPLLSSGWYVLFYDMRSQIISSLSAYWVHHPYHTMSLVLQRSIVVESGKYNVWESRLKEEC